MRPAKVFSLIGIVVSLFASGSAMATIGEGTAAPSNSEQWIVVPSWLSGTWQARFQTFLDTYDCRLGKRTLEQPATLQIHRSRTIGVQQDASGQIWHYAGTPYMRTAETDSYVENQKITELKVLSSQPNMLKLCTTGEVCRKSKLNSEQFDDFYEQTVVTYVPLSEGVIKVDLSITDFDAQGKPLRQSQSVCVERRVKPFIVVNRDERGDLREKFLNFMSELNSPSGHAGNGN